VLQRITTQPFTTKNWGTNANLGVREEKRQEKISL
jgi:hypothetical protein